MSDLILTGGVPYRNLLLSGSLGARLIPVGQAVAARLDAPFYSLESELQVREGKYADELRKLYGEAYVKRLEMDICREFALRRSTVIAVNPVTLLDEDTRARLTDAGDVLILTCALNETLRRLHILQGTRFHDPTYRAAVVYTLKRDGALLGHDLRRLDTTSLSIDQTADQAIHFWKTGARVT